MSIIAMQFVMMNNLSDISLIEDREVFYTFQEKYPGQMVSYKENNGVITFSSSNETHLRVEFLSSNILRFRYSVRPYFQANFSYAIDPNFERTPPLYQVSELESKVVITLEKFEVHIMKNKLLVHIFDLEGKIIVSDEKGFHWEERADYGGEVVKMSKTALVGEAFYGLGDKTTVQNLRGKRFENWGSDEYGFKAGTDPLYKNINLYYSYHQEKAYGLYFDNSFKTYFDIAKEREDIVSFWADGGEMDYYFLYGENLLEVASQYSELTGKAEMPPLWALGYQQCKWSYYPESKVKEITETMRALEIPCDAIYLDIDYMDGFRCFTWDESRFPDPKRMVQELKENGFKTIAIIDPGIKIDMEYEVFREGLVNGYFCKRMDGTHMQGKVWPGECYFPDFTNPEVRKWWAGLFEDLIGNIGLAGIWNDMNEPAIFDVPSKTFPLDVRHNYDGHPCSHRKAHNVYGMQMTRATSEGVKQFAGNKRPLLISRSGYAGMQRYTSAWTGDNLASWEHLFLAHMQTLRLSVSGVSFCGSDIGGFIDQPDGELYVRWMQLAVFHPFFRTHSSGDDGDQEPWSFGPKNTALVRSAIKLRYALLPYMYTCFYEHYRSGEPILRPLIFNTGKEEHREVNDEAFLGKHILFCPVFQKNARIRSVYLPEGQWYDYEDLAKYEGDEVYSIKSPLTKIPFFVKSGAVIPMFPPMQYVGEKAVEEITLKIFYNKGSETSNFYFDDLDGYEYKDGAFRLTQFTTEGSTSHFTISQDFEGSFVPSYDKYRLHFIGLSARELNIEVNGQWQQQYNKINGNIVELLVDRDFRSVNINF